MKHLIKYNESSSIVNMYESYNNKFIIIPNYEILYNVDEMYILYNENMIFIGNSSIEDYMVVGDPIAHLTEINDNYEEGFLSIDEFVEKTRKYAEVVNIFYGWGDGRTINEIKQSKEHKLYLKKEKSKKFKL